MYVGEEFFAILWAVVHCDLKELAAIYTNPESKLEIESSLCESKVN